MHTTAGQWAKDAQIITDRLMRGTIHETLIHAFRAHTNRPTTDLQSRIKATHQRMLTGALHEELRGSAGDMEKLSYGYIRLILLAHRDERFIPALSFSWHVAIIIARWADADIDGAVDEVERNLREGEATGPNHTRKRYKIAMAGLGRSMENDGDTGPVRPRVINKLTFDMIAQDDYQALPGLLATFKTFEFGWHVSHVIATELPRLAREGCVAEIETIVEHLRADGTPSKYLKPTAVFLIRNGMFKDLATREALYRVDQLPANDAIFKSFFEKLQAMVPVKPRRLSPDKKAWREHPHWSKVRQHQAAEYGRRLFKRNFYEWCMAIEENQDPDNHPLNFFMYDARYKRRYGSTC